MARKDQVRLPDGEGPELGLAELVAIGVGGMIGGGIFSVLGLAVDVSGHAAPLSFLIGSLIAATAGYSYVRLSLTYRSDGASFTYLERAFPEHVVVAGIAGWTVVVGYVGTLALYAFTFGAYSAHLLGLEHSAVTRHLLSATSLLLFLGVNLHGAGTMGKAEDVVVYLKVVLLGILAAVGFTVVSPARMSPFFDRGPASFLLGGALIFVAYEGFQLITNAVCETRDPERNISRGLYGSIAVTSVIYVAIAVVAVGSLETAALRAADEYALAAVAQPVLGRIGVVLVDLAAMLATSSAINATLFGSSHLAYEIARDNLAPKAFSFRTRKGVPAEAAVVITVLSLVLAVAGGLEFIASFSSLTFLLVSMGVCVANLKLRRRTRSAVAPVVLGMVLMGTTVCLLVYYLGENGPRELATVLGIYAATALGFTVFHSQRRGRGAVGD